MSPEKSNDPRNEPRHSIAVVSRRTGLSQLVLRAWERRYQAVIPSRTATGRRKYSDFDLEKLLVLGRLTGGGHRIGDVAGFSLEQLQELAQDLDGTSAGKASASSAAGLAGGAPELLQEALAAVTELSSRGLEAVLDRALVELSKPDLRQQLLVPLLVEIGKQWREGKLRIAHEHMATSIIKSFIATINSRYRVAPGAPVMAVATPAGQMHELGALFAASHACEAGWDVLYLGPNLPAEEIASAARSRDAKAVLLSLVFPHGDGHTSTELLELRRLLGADALLIIGGQAAESYAQVLSQIGATTFNDPQGLEKVLTLF